jgi:tetrahydromethanopterin S-methyltransferase subunit C
MGLLSGIIGSLILNLLLIFGLGAIDNIIGWISTGMGTIADVIIAGYVIFQLSVIACMILGAFGGVVGVIVKK